jgi:hypothetical protein
MYVDLDFVFFSVSLCGVALLLVGFAAAVATCGVMFWVILVCWYFILFKLLLSCHFVD